MSCCHNRRHNREYESVGRRENDAYDNRGFTSDREFDAFERGRCRRCNNRCTGILCNICRCFFNCRR